MWFKCKNNLIARGFGLVFCLGSLFLSACFPPPPAPGGNVLTTPPRGDDYYDRKNRDDKDRGSVLDRSKKRYSGPKCEGDDDCEDICKDIYSRRSVRDDCLELAAEQVEKLWEIYEIFENPREDDLEDIDPEDLETFVEIDLRPLDTLIGKLTSSEAKRVLVWIAVEPDVTEVFKDEDDDYDLLKELLQALGGTQQQALGKSIEDGNNFVELISEEDFNEIALEWVHGFLYKECDNDSKGEEVCVLQDWYCEFDLSDDSWDALVGYEDFEDMVDEILDDYTTASATSEHHGLTWWVIDDDDIDANNLNIVGSGSNQLEELCDLTLEKDSG